jgi:hypothetical protein
MVNILESNVQLEGHVFHLSLSQTKFGAQKRESNNNNCGRG